MAGNLRFHATATAVREKRETLFRSPHTMAVRALVVKELGQWV